MLLWFLSKRYRTDPSQTNSTSSLTGIKLEQLSADVYDFSTGYIDDDSFNFLTAQDEAVYSQALKHNNIADPSFVNQGIVLGNVYAQGATSLLENPTAWLARLSASATPFPYSSSLMSQASGLLLGYKSLVSQDILSVTASIPAVTPGVSVKVAPASTAAGATTATRGQTTSATGAAATAQSTSTLKALGVPVATANAQLIYAGVAAAAGIFGIALL